MAANTTFTNQTSSLPASDKIQGIREQILANAAILFPQAVATSYSYTQTKVIKPSEIFQVIITRENDSSRALLLYGDGLAKRVAARGPAGGEAEQALSGLLTVVSEALGWFTTTSVGEVENSEEVAGGEINFQMVEEGFHFVAVERYCKKN